MLNNKEGECLFSLVRQIYISEVGGVYIIHYRHIRMLISGVALRADGGYHSIAIHDVYS